MVGRFVCLCASAFRHLPFAYVSVFSGDDFTSSNTTKTARTLNIHDLSLDSTLTQNTYAEREFFFVVRMFDAPQRIRISFEFDAALEQRTKTLVIHYSYGKEWEPGSGIHKEYKSNGVKRMRNKANCE